MTNIIKFFIVGMTGIMIGTSLKHIFNKSTKKYTLTRDSKKKKQIVTKPRKTKKRKLVSNLNVFTHTLARR